MKKTYVDCLLESIIQEDDQTPTTAAEPEIVIGDEEAAPEDISNEKIYTLPKSDLADIQKKIDKLNKKAAAVGTPTVSIEVVNEYMLPIRNFTDDPNYQDQEIEAVDVVVKGVAPTAKDWLFIAIVRPTITTDRNVIHQIPGSNVEIPAKYRVGMPPCEQCCENRRRDELYVVYNTKTKEFKTVGSTCLEAFVGEGVNPESILKYVDVVKKIRELLNGYNMKNVKTAKRLLSKPSVRKDFFWIPNKKFIEKVLMVLEGYKGWPPRQLTHNVKNIAVKAYYTPSSREVDPAIEKEADDIIAWGTGEFQKQSTAQISQDDANLQALFKKGALDPRSIYNMTRGVLLYKEQKQKTVPAAPAAPAASAPTQSSLVNKGVGDQVDVEVTLADIYRNQGQSGPYYTVWTKDGMGNTVYWWAGADAMAKYYNHLKKGEKYTVQGVVKDKKDPHKFRLALPVRALPVQPKSESYVLPIRRFLARFC